MGELRGREWPRRLRAMWSNLTKARHGADPT
jgi:hypothetical protein